MRPKFSLRFSDDDYQKLLEDEITIEEFLIETLDDSSPENFDGNVMCGHLVSYHDTEGGAPEVNDFEIEDAKFDKVTSHGSFTTNFTVSFFYGCSDIDSESYVNAKWDFNIVPETSTIHFTGEEKMEREPDAY